MLLFSERILQIIVMKKEMLCMYVESAQVKEKCYISVSTPVLRLVRRLRALLGLGD